MAIFQLLIAAFVALPKGALAGNGTYFRGEDPCPTACRPDNAVLNWTTYNSLDRLDFCDKPMLLSFMLHNPLESPDTSVTIKACLAGASDLERRGTLSRRQDSNSTALNSTTLTGNHPATLQVLHSPQTNNLASASVGNNPVDIGSGISILRASAQLPGGSSRVVYHNGAALGFFVGARIDTASFDSTVLQRLAEGKPGPGTTTMMQACGEGRDSDFTVGVIAASGGNAATVVATVQKALASWSNATCHAVPDASSTSSVEVVLTAQDIKKAEDQGNSLRKRADCRTIEVVSGDDCGKLAVKCGIRGSDYTKYNPASNHCSTLAVGQRVCCSAGTLPDITPKPQPDGTCAVYTTVDGDYCNAIAVRNGLSVEKLEEFNKKTWGWRGCNDLQLAVKMCLSSGSPPMPNVVENAVCGPQKPGTTKPSNMDDLTKLNQCPLNACCNVWGQCGTTPEFCVDTNTGAPGTAKPGTNGCISNCGTEIVNNGSPPSQFLKIGYFQAYNVDRKCLKMDVTQMDKSYTHIHFSFAELTPDFQVDLRKIQSQWARFKTMKTSSKKILVFGGWAFSTEPATYMIFRNMVSNSANRERAASNIANFITSNNLDGVDIDWEYPGAPDIPGIPPGDTGEGNMYTEFLRLLKGKLPNKSVAIASPASFWYLKGFPIARISGIVDYIIFMTYDLHGQWDFGNKWSAPGCPSGNCLRSHVNLTETHNALSMVTKAGVPAWKLILGVSSYGRSFRMSQAGCTGPMCPFDGPTSNAKAGECTETPGYLANAEIDKILKTVPGARTYREGGAAVDSDVMIYNDREWVAYMSDATKNSRINRYRGWNFGGTCDWAVDLQREYDPKDIPGPVLGNPDSPFTAQGALRPILKACDATQGQKVWQSWREANSVAYALKHFYPGNKWSRSFTTYLGVTMDKEHDFRFSNLMREYRIHHAFIGSEPRWTYPYFYCSEEEARKDFPKKGLHYCDMCLPGGGQLNAYTFDQLGWFWTNHIVVLCPKFFRMTSLEKLAREAQFNDKYKDEIEYWQGTSAGALIHESYHWENTVGRPKIDHKPEVYDAELIVNFAKDEDVSMTISAYNAESYATATLANFVWQKFERSLPPHPQGTSPDRKFRFRGRRQECTDLPVIATDTGADVLDPAAQEFIWADEQYGEVDVSFLQLPDGCLEGQWSGLDMCGENCKKGGRCTENDKGAVCDCSPDAGVCKEGGPHDSFAKCHENCRGGTCMESAGEGIRCQDCP